MNPYQFHFSNKIRELRLAKKISATEMEKALGLSAGSWSRYERSLTAPSLFVGHKIAEFFGVSLDELVGEKVDKSHVSLLRLKHTEAKMDSEEFAEVWLIARKVWDLISADDHGIRKENMRIIDAVANLLHNLESQGQKEASHVSFDGVKGLL